MNEIYFEYIGYLASALVAMSFTLKNIRNLRVINTLGAIVFVIYGFLIDSMPIVITNVFILCFNIYYLSKKK